jgi:hypothetical protein
MTHHTPGAPQRIHRTMGEAFGHGPAWHITEAPRRGRAAAWGWWAVCVVLVVVAVQVLR